MKPTRQQRHLRAWRRKYFGKPVDEHGCHEWACWHAHVKDGRFWRYAGAGRLMRYANVYRKQKTSALKAAYGGWYPLKKRQR